jgi:hypothetical protein
MDGGTGSGFGVDDGVVLAIHGELLSIESENGVGPNRTRSIPLWRIDARLSRDAR